MTASSAARTFRIVGIDVATQARSVGLACCTVSGTHARLEAVQRKLRWPEIDRQVAQWLHAPTLVAIDAPLGWPAPLADTLGCHQAGASLPPAANALFRRRTDDVVANALGKRPLDVGADRIARTAHTALAFLMRLRKAAVQELPLAWQPGTLDTSCAVEVYPAGTLASRGLPSSGYKGSGSGAVALRGQIIEAVMREISLAEKSVSAMAGSDHLLDAALCCLAGIDFLNARVIAPENLELAQREGWIWVAAPH